MRVCATRTGMNISERGNGIIISACNDNFFAVRCLPRPDSIENLNCKSPVQVVAPQQADLF